MKKRTKILIGIGLFFLLIIVGLLVYFNETFDQTITSGERETQELEEEKKYIPTAIRRGVAVNATGYDQEFIDIVLESFLLIADVYNGEVEQFMVYEQFEDKIEELKARDIELIESGTYPENEEIRSLLESYLESMDMSLLMMDVYKESNKNNDYRSEHEKFKGLYDEMAKFLGITE